jgi:hypothetical protein
MAKFSRQDYVSIARVIDTTWRKLFASAVTTDQRFGVKVDMDAVVTAFADMFAADNPRFDRERFVMACEGEDQS